MVHYGTLIDEMYVCIEIQQRKVDQGSVSLLCSSYHDPLQYLFYRLCSCIDKLT